MNDIVMVNDANVESVIAADKPVILAIGASWCPDCRRAQPFFMPHRRGEDAVRAQGLRRAQHLTPARVLLGLSRSEISS